MSNISMNQRMIGQERYSVTLDSLRSMFDTDKAGKFTTSVSDTRGQLSFNADGRLQNTNRKWYQHQVPSTADQDTIELRYKILDMFQNEGHMSIDSAFMKKACRMLGISEDYKNGTVLLGEKGELPAKKPLERAVVKQLLMDFDAAKKMQADIASFEIPDEAEIATIRKEERLERLSGMSEPEMRKEEISSQVATNIMRQWESFSRENAKLSKQVANLEKQVAAMKGLPNVPDAQLQKAQRKLKYTQDAMENILRTYGTGKANANPPTYATVYAQVKQRIETEPAFSNILTSHITEQSKQELVKAIKDGFGNGFKLMLTPKQMAEGNKNHGIATDFIRTANAFTTHSTSTLNNERISGELLVVTDENKEQLEKEFGSYDHPEKFGEMNSIGHGVYGTTGAAVAHQILSKLPNNGSDYKNLMMYLTTQLSYSGFLGTLSEEENTEKNFGFGKMTDYILAGGGMPKLHCTTYHLNITDKEIVLEMDAGIGADFLMFAKNSSDPMVDFGTAKVKMTIPLKGNSDKDVKFGTEPKGLDIQVGITTLEEEVKEFQDHQNEVRQQRKAELQQQKLDEEAEKRGELTEAQRQVIIDADDDDESESDGASVSSRFVSDDDSMWDNDLNDE